ncbi:MAG: hypothetical protein L6R35_007343, partial [Caloplaca aegaea]
YVTACNRNGAVLPSGLLANYKLLVKLLELSPTCSANITLLRGFCCASGSRKVSEDAFIAGTMLKHLRRLKTRRLTWSMATRKLNAEDVSLLQNLLDCATECPWTHAGADSVAPSAGSGADMLALEDRNPPVSTETLGLSSGSTDFVVGPDCDRLLQAFGQQASRHGGPKGPHTRVRARWEASTPQISMQLPKAPSICAFVHTVFLFSVPRRSQPLHGDRPHLSEGLGADVVAHKEPACVSR